MNSVVTNRKNGYKTLKKKFSTDFKLKLMVQNKSAGCDMFPFRTRLKVYIKVGRIFTI